MADQRNLTRLLQLIDLLHPPGKTIGFIAGFLECGRRTAYRYLKNFEEEGFLVKRDKAGRFSIAEPASNTRKVQLTDEEASFLSTLMATAAPAHHLTPSIQTKLFFRSNLGKLVKNNFRKNVPVVVTRLLDAMAMNRQVELNSYFSASTGLEQTRVVEPLDFTENYRYLLAYEQAGEIVVNLRLDRIAHVTILEKTCIKKPDEVLKGVDVFDIAFNHERHQVELLLTPLAYRLLLEEYPASEKFMNCSGDETFPFRFSAPVANLLPVGRFCLGLPGNVRPRSPDALVAYLQKKVTEYSW